ncbi:hypothetical protein [Rubrivirga marina]|uniref:hypothetical protein n=1 Tax=Rubrivirga marina TaxID=1196024 RepID=UPI00117BBADA|nr:hypothetical protein [Rubrivirga marina]
MADPLPASPALAKHIDSRGESYVDVAAHLGHRVRASVRDLASVGAADFEEPVRAGYEQARGCGQKAPRLADIPAIERDGLEAGGRLRRVRSETIESAVCSDVETATVTLHVEGDAEEARVLVEHGKGARHVCADDAFRQREPEAALGVEGAAEY